MFCFVCFWNYDISIDIIPGQIFLCGQLMMLVCWFVVQASEALGPIDILINCAGFAVCGLFEETSIEDFKVEVETIIYYQRFVWDVIFRTVEKPSVTAFIMERCLNVSWFPMAFIFFQFEDLVKTSMGLLNFIKYLWWFERKKGLFFYF